MAEWTHDGKKGNECFKQNENLDIKLDFYEKIKGLQK